MSTQPKTLLTPEQYLEIERKSEHKSEYHQGEMFAMSSASLIHNRLVRRLMYELGPAHACDRSSSRAPTVSSFWGIDRDLMATMEDEEEIRDGKQVHTSGIEWTAKDGIPYHAPTLMSRVKEIVSQARNAGNAASGLQRRAQLARCLW